MGVGRRRLAPLWALALALACAQHTGQAQDSSAEPSYEHPDISPVAQGPSGDPLRVVTILPPLRTTPVVRALNPAHNGRVCSTWGNFHYKTFDGDVFRFPGLCNYVFSAHCGAAYEDFNVQLRRGRDSNTTTLSRVVMKLDGMVVELTQSSVLVNGLLVRLPFSQSGVLIEHSSSYLKVVARLGLVFMWNQDDSLLLELDNKYANQTCGLCGDFNGVPIFNEFFSHNVKLTPFEFGNLQKMDGPMEQCQDPIPASPENCSTDVGVCKEILSSQMFSSCNTLVDVGSYVEACQQDLCLCEHSNLTSCLCHTLAEYSRQCAHAGGLPRDWRSPDLCPVKCPLNLQYRECGSPCSDTCSNREHSQLCEDHCIAGCFCPEGMVLDDIGQTGCVPVSQCSCVYNGATYASGAVYSTDCTNCTCSGGRWSCQEVPCLGTCSVLGGAHFSTFDERLYTMHGDCTYVLTKPCNSSAFTVLAELRKCGLTDSETCLKSLTLSLDGGQTVIVVKASGEVFVNQIYTQLPVSAANVTLFRPSTFFIIVQTNLGLQLEVQLVPAMQVFVRLAPTLRGLTCGLCGNFNSVQADDFRTLSGVVEGTAAAFANTWKTQAACPNVKNSFEDPCSLSVENEKYAQHWCSRLTDPQGPFAGCHGAVNPSSYYSNCMFDTCNCEKSEVCLCAALSSYVWACATRGVLLSGWRDGVCTKPMTTCPKSMTYQYHISTCQPTCRARSEDDVTCGISFVPVDGCTCPNDTFLDDTGKCVPATSCPCYLGGSVVPNGESLHESGAVCTCTQGRLTCIGGHTPAPVCASPMVYFDCRNATPGAAGAGCQKSCHTLDMDCYSSQCVSGCVCPQGLVADGQGGCIAAADCPCVHNEASYQAGQTIRVGCNTCTCKSRVWQCTDEPCLATCAVYGDGHYLTFDGQRYSFSGDCEYTLVQDHCGQNSSAQEAFRVVTENVPCGTTGTTCSKAIKIFLGSYELKLSDGKVEVIEKGAGREVPYSIRHMGIYLVVDTEVGLLLLWDKKTSIFIRLSPEFKGRVCGLCGNFDDNAVNDFTTRSQSVVGNALEFGNSWKFSPSCPDAPAPKDPCTANPYRKSWAQKQCSIINSATFATCHAHVEPAKYYEACVSDACACDSGGDCECFCTAVAAYAQACHEVGVCVSWRSPDVCPLFCDYYNPEGQCEWHYQPCGAPCMKTCQNPSGQCLHDVRGLEGCYPKCPAEAPLFDEDQMQCVATCPQSPCRIQGKSYQPGMPVPSDENCHSCVCTESGVQCTYDAEACVCTYDGQRFRPGHVIYHTMDGTGGCISAHCGTNGTIDRRVYACSSTTPAPQTTFSFSTAPLVVSSTRLPITYPSPTESTPSSAPASPKGTSPRPMPSTASTSPHPDCGEECQWSAWLDISRPGQGIDSGDFDTLENLRAHGYRVCQVPRAVECRAEAAPEVPLQILGQRVECSPAMGLTCYNKDQASGLCDNYQIKILCCSPLPCTTSGGAAQTTPPATSRTTETGPTPGTSRVTSVPTGSTASPALVTTTGPTTLSTTGKTPAPGITTTAPGTPTAAPGTSITVKTTISTSSPMSVSTTASATSSESTKAPGSSEVPGKLTPPEPTHISCLQEFCSWTRWIDGSYPGPGRNSGDFDTFQNLRSKGYKFCEKPSKVECRAQAFPDTPLEELGQDVICDNKLGLLCLNKNQLPPICYNYEIRIQCCELVDMCRQSTTAQATGESPHSTPQETRVKAESPWTTATHFVSTRQTGTSSGTGLGTSGVIASTPTVTTLGTTNCQPQCKWTKWFDVEFPSPGPHGGDSETYSNILRSGEKICTRPEYITHLECRAESHPEVSIEQLGQVVQCDPDVGLVCRNQDQEGHGSTCLNYEIRVLCCEPREGCPPPTPVPLPSTSRVSSSSPEATSHVATSRTTSVPKTSRTPVPRPSTTSVPGPGPTSAPETSTKREVRTSTTSVPGTSPTPVQKTSRTSVPRPSKATAPGSSPSTELRTSTTSVPGASPTSVHRAGTSPAPASSTTSVRAPETTHSPPATSRCQPRCKWTKWFDVEFPSPGPHGGDSETYSNILRSGEKICTRPEYITHLECRAESHPEVSIEQLGQVVQCDPDVGLVCRNQDQEGHGSTCLNYEIRVLCCEPREGCPPPTPVPLPSTSRVSSSSPEATSHVATSRTTSVPKTSRTPVPRPSTTSVPGPGPTSVPETSTKREVRTSTTSVPGTSPTPVQKTSRTSVPRPSKATAPGSSPSTELRTSTTSVPGASPTSVHRAGTSPAPASSTTSVRAPETTHSPPATSRCQPRCKWTKWFDVEFPSPGPHGGDSETYSNILRSGEKICTRPEYITHLECRAESHPEVSIEQLGQVVQCDPDVGLVCRNQDQEGHGSTCLNYEIRVLCCEPREGCPPPTPVPLPSTSRVSSSSPEATSHVATSRTTSVPKTSRTPVPRPSTTSVPGPGPTSVPETSTKREVRTSTTSVPGTSPTPVQKTSRTSVPRPSKATAPGSSPSTELRTSTTSVPGASPTSVHRAGTSPAPASSTTSVRAPETTHSPPATSRCQPRCKWTKWFDVEFPSPGPHGGDSETYSNILRSGEKICTRPEYITHLECRAESHPEVSIEQLGQVVQCDPDVGLVCRNQDQEGHGSTCLNYEIRVLCCEPREGCPPPTPVPLPSTSRVSSSSPEATSHVATSRTTSVPKTSRTPVPRPSTTSVPGPGPTSVPETSTKREVRTSTTSVPGTSPTPVQKTSRTSVPRPSKATAPGSSPSTELRTSTTSVPGASPTSVHRAGTSPAPASSTTSVRAPETTHSPPATSRCQPRCKWTKWFDVEFPSPGPHGGDSETYSNILRSGEKICTRPEYITHLECRAESHPEVSIEQLGQVVQCDPDVGLVCRNQDQEGHGSTCLNYEIRVLCCEPREGCPPPTPVPLPSTSRVSSSSPEATSHVATSRTTSVPKTSRTPVPRPSTTSVPGPGPTSAPETSTKREVRTSTTSVPGTSPTPVQKTSRTSVPRPSKATAPGSSPSTELRTSTTSVPGASPTSVHRAGTSPAPASSTTSVRAPETTHSPPATSRCQPRCKWTKWFDVEFPSPGPHGGDSETYSNILRSGEKICTRPEYITHLECRAESHPEVSIEQLGQVVQCDPDVGLVCRNQDQEGHGSTCLNYEIRVLCCEPREGCPPPTPVPLPSTSRVSSSSPEATSHVATSRTTSVPKTSRTPVPRPSTTSVPGPGPTSVPETSTKREVRTSTTSVPGTSPTPVQKTSRTSVPRPSKATAPGSSPSTELRTSTTSVPGASPTSVHRAGTSPAPASSTTSVRAPETTHSPPATSRCQPRCKWTKWFDVEFPSPGPHGGDSETYSNILRSGEKICTRPEYITHLECRAESHPEVSIEQLGQVVQCDPDVGLVCRNQDQEGHGSTCLNYEIRVLCCEPREGCPPPTPVPLPSTSRVSSSSPEATSHVATSRTTSVPKTSRTPVPRPSTTSVPGPGPTSVPETSTKREVRTSTTSVPGTSPTPVQKTSRTSVPRPSKATAPGSSPSTELRTSTTSVPGASPTSVHRAGTSPAPASSTTSVRAPETTHSPPATSRCQPRCKWTKWFDVEFPSPGPHGGDSETYSNILRSGEKICTRPEYITHLECRAESHPEVSIEQLGQVVQCDPDVGLVCRNQDQEGHGSTCLNYEIRVLCCEPREGCLPPTPVPLPSTSRVSSSSPEATSHVATSRTTSVPKTSRTPVPRPSTTSVPGPGPTSAPETSTKREVRTSTTSVPGTSPTPVQKTSRTSVPRPSKATAPGSSPSTELRTSTTSVPGASPTSVHRAGTSPAPASSTTSVRAPETTHSPPATSRCQPRCKWTKWFDVEFPSPGPHGGDSETYSNILRSGEKICTRPEYITHLECRAESHPEVSIEQLGQVVQCDPDVGLVCRNQDQEGHGSTCLNYEIRVLCCEPREGCPPPTPVPLPSTSRVSSSSPEATSHVATSRTTSVPKTSRTPVPRPSTTSVPGPGPTSAPETSTKREVRTSTTSVPGTSPTPVQKTSRTSVPRPSKATAPGSSPSTELRTSTTSVPGASPTSVHRAGTSPAPASSTTSVRAPETTHSPPATSRCQPRCKWTKWFDVEFPSPGPHGGDSETYSNILRSGEKICTRPEYTTHLECRAESHPEVSIEQLGQVVQCDPDVGLVCRNQDQEGHGSTCLNYEIRVLCCEPREGCPPPTPVPLPSTSRVSSSSPEATSHVATSRTTSVPKTSRTPVPRPSTTSVPGPGPTSVPETSTKREVRTSTTSVPGTSPTPVQKTSRTSVPRPSKATAPGSSPSTELRTSTTSVPGASPTSVHRAGTSPAPASSTTSVRAPETTHSPPATSRCQPRCKWTKWFDVEFPSPGPHGGDSETYSNILRSGEKICTRPEYITHLECRAESHPEVSIEQLGQVVQCDPDVGLVCRNQDQEGHGSTCLNYEIRVLCCEPREGCPPPTPVPLPSTSRVSSSSPEATSHVATSRTTSVPKTSRTPVPRPSTTSVPGPGPTSVPETSTKREVRTSTTSVPGTSPTPVQKTSRTSVPRPSKATAPGSSPSTELRTSTTSVPGASPTSVHRAGTSPAPASSTTSVRAPETTHSPPATSRCQPRCKWTKWFDVEFPSPGPHGGDSETYSNILRSGEKICTRPEYITHLECRAESHPEVSIEQLGQVVQCDPDVGLVCRNQDQEGHGSTCLNYEIRVLCCEPREGCPPPTPVPLPSTSRLSSSSPEATSHVATSRTTSVPKTSRTPVPRPSTTSVPGPGPTSVPETSTKREVRTSTTSVPGTSPTPVQKTSRTSVPRPSKATAPGSSPSTELRTSTTSVPGASPTSVHRAGTSPAPASSTTSVRAPETTHSPPATSRCQPRCKWTKWFDVEFPSPGPHGGDSETYSNILRSGEKICTRPEYITHLECRAESHPEVSIEQLGQVVQCDPDVGLVCRNQDQEGHGSTCLNYEIRVLCCEPREGCPPPTPVPLPSTSRLSSSSPEATSHVATSRTTSVPKTSRTPVPRPSTTSVLGPIPRTEQEISGSPVSPHVTSSIRHSPPSEPTSVVSTVKSLSSPLPSPSTCYCSVSHKLYPAGSIIYQQIDLAGHCYYAVCSLDCHVVRRSDETCPTSTPPPAPATSSPASSPSGPVPVTHHGCSNISPPRMKGETWNMPNCSQATCEGHNIITLQPRQCPTVQEPTCANGYPAVQVVDQDSCCPHYECQCVCSGWGDPHYITFDGTYYTFLDNCTYVLVQQIVPVYGHLRVLIDNYFCDAEDGLSCPQSIIVEYRQDRVMMTRKPVRGVMTNEIIFNGKVVSPGFQKDGIDVSQIGIKMYVSIPEIGVQVMFSGLIFSVEVPFSKFANNTEGQCGTCTNDPKEECRLPGGAVVASCSEMAGHWKVTNPNQPSCHGPPPTPTAGPTPTPSPASCPPSPICQLILSEVFEPCHSVISPGPFYQGCVFDQCHVTDLEVVCSGLELYAALCASQGVCIDWRGRTNHTCSFTCPPHKVYRPCGPSNPPHCHGDDHISLMALQEAGPITEGCFCPEDMMLFSTSVDVCVPTGCPRCQGPHGEPVEPGHNVSIDCQECTCDGSTWKMSCRRQSCPLPHCPEPGFVPVAAAPQAGQCCPQYSCACNTSSCPAPLDCPKGSRLTLAYEEGSCCPKQNCSWTVCSVNGTLYQPGAVVSSTLCETCRCEVPGGPESDTFVISCETQICNTYCPVGFEYQARSGQCCGECVQMACVMNTSDSSAHLFYPGKSWSDPGNRCVTYECEKHRDGLVVVTTRKACPQLSCPLDQARLSEDGCCLSCPQLQPQNRSTCAVYDKHQLIRQQGCSSSGPVRLTYCQGNCGDTTSMYSLEANRVERTCRCCQELRVSLRNVTLHCADGSSRAFSYTQVEECGCVGLRCNSHSGGPEELGPVQIGDEQSRETEHRRRKREAQGSGPHQ
ncbi:mucin-5AC [Equus asinus]|uniref:mucin-5AC n=1 Tax=Equus asinus TaxID=9793 RepID=UPI0038F6EB7B